MTSPQIIGIDFDGTIVTHEYPRIGTPIKGAIETMSELIENGHHIILWTMRSGQELKDAVDYLSNNGIFLFGVNKNPEQNWSDSPKAYCHIYIDDAALGCPLERLPNQRPMVYWPTVRRILEHRGLLTNSSGQQSGG